jgi:hypothetical protein
MNETRLKLADGKANYWYSIKDADINKLIENAGGLFMEATAVNQLNVIGDSIRINLVFNNRTGIPINRTMVSVFGTDYTFDSFKTNEQKTKTITASISDVAQASQPYWLERGLENGTGSFDIRDQQLIGNAEIYNYKAHFQVTIGKDVYEFYKPILYKYTDPVKGELYQPIQIVNPVFINSKQNFIIFKNEDKNQQRNVEFSCNLIAT